MKRKTISPGFSILFLLVTLAIFPCTPAQARNPVPFELADGFSGSRLIFPFTYHVGTNPVDIDYVLHRFINDSPVPVQLPDDLTSLYENGILLASVNYRDLKPATTEFIQFIAEVDQAVGQSNIYQWIIMLIEWLKQFIPEPPPEPDPGVPADFSGVVWLHANVSGWAQTSVLSSVTMTSSTITLDYDKTNVWPGVYINGVKLNANPWIFVKLDGVWYAATWEWMKVGQTTKNLYAVNGDHIKVPPLDTFVPVSGVSYGFMVSGLARMTERNVYERTNVLMVTWP